MVQINNLMSDIWKVFGFIIAGALAVNAVQAAMGLAVKGKVDFPQIGFEKGTTERGVSKVSKSC